MQDDDDNSWEPPGMADAYMQQHTHDLHNPAEELMSPVQHDAVEDRRDLQIQNQIDQVHHCEQTGHDAISATPVEATHKQPTIGVVDRCDHSEAQRQCAPMGELANAHAGPVAGPDSFNTELPKRAAVKQPTPAAEAEADALDPYSWYLIKQSENAQIAHATTAHQSTSGTQAGAALAESGLSMLTEDSPCKLYPSASSDKAAYTQPDSTSLTDPHPADPGAALQTQTLHSRQCLETPKLLVESDQHTAASQPDISSADSLVKASLQQEAMAGENSSKCMPWTSPVAPLSGVEAVHDAAQTGLGKRLRSEGPGASVANKRQRLVERLQPRVAKVLRLVSYMLVGHWVWELLWCHLNE